VENSVGYVRRNWLVGAPEFADWDELNAYLQEKSEADQPRRPRGKEATVAQLLAEERAQMRPLPDRPFSTAKRVAVQANKLSLVTFATNRYSVPVSHAHESLTLRASAQWARSATGKRSSPGIGAVGAGARLWINPNTGVVEAVPRHKEIKESLARKILKRLDAE